VSKQPTYYCLLQHHAVAHQLFMNFERLLSCAGCHGLLISNIVVIVVKVLRNVSCALAVHQAIFYPNNSLCRSTFRFLQLTVQLLMLHLWTKLCLSAANILLPHFTWICLLARDDGHILMLNNLHCVLNNSMMYSIVYYGRAGRTLHKHQLSSRIKTGHAVCCWPRCP